MTHLYGHKVRVPTLNQSDGQQAFECRDGVRHIAEDAQHETLLLRETRQELTSHDNLAELEESFLYFILQEWYVLSKRLTKY